VGKCPEAFAARRRRALRLSTAFVVEIRDLISLSKERKGTISGQARSHNRMIAGYVASQASWNSRNRSIAASALGAVYTGLRSLASAAQSRLDAY